MRRERAGDKISVPEMELARLIDRVVTIGGFVTAIRSEDEDLESFVERDEATGEPIFFRVGFEFLEALVVAFGDFGTSIGGQKIQRLARLGNTANKSRDRRERRRK